MRNLWTLFVIGLATGFVGEKLFVLSQPTSPSADDLYIEGHSSGDFPVDDEDNEDFNSGSGSGDIISLIDVLQNEARLKNFSFGGPEVLPTQEVVPADIPTTTQASSPNQPTTAESSPYPPTTEEDSVTSSYILPEEETETESEMMLPDALGTSDSTGHTSSTTTESYYPDSSSVPTSQSSSPTDGSNDILSEEKPDEKVSEDTVEGVEADIDVGADGRGSRMLEAESPEEVTSENMWERTEVLAAVIACGVIGFLCALFLLLLLVYRMKKKDEGSYDLGDGKMPPTAYQKAPTKEFYA